MYDTIIIGGGIGGLQAAIQLGRSLHRVLVIDHKRGRSIVAKNYRNILGYPDGISGEYLRQTGEKQARSVGVQFLLDEAVGLTQDADGLFHVQVRSQPQCYTAKTLAIATGITDPFPSIPGLAPCLGESVYICPDCDGYEIVNRKTVVIGSGPEAIHMASLLTYFTDKLVVINHRKNDLRTADESLLRELSLPYYDQEVSSVQEMDGQITGVTLSSGERIACERGFLAFAGAHVNTDLLKGFSVQLLHNGHIQVHPRTQETDHPGIWAIGDIVAHSQQVTVAMGDGAKAAIWIHKRLLEQSKTESKF